MAVDRISKRSPGAPRAIYGCSYPVDDPEGQAILNGRYARQAPAARQLASHAFQMPAGETIDVANDSSLRPVKCGKSVLLSEIERIVAIGGAEDHLARRLNSAAGCRGIDVRHILAPGVGDLQEQAL